MSEKKYIEVEAVCYQLSKQATIDGQPRAIRRAAKIVEDFPAADVRPVVRGKWIPWMRIPEDYVCDKCEWHSRIKTNFCPNCGADMREES